MTPVDRDHFLQALRATMKFFGKELEESDARFWITTMSDYPWLSIRDALLEYPKRGRYAPKPRDVIEIIGERTQARASGQSSLPPPKLHNCDPTVAAAWRYWIPRFHGMHLGGALAPDDGVTHEQADEYLAIINRQVFESNYSPAEKLEQLPAAFRLAEIWGPDAQRTAA